jgi:hypothetical protein
MFYSIVASLASYEPRKLCKPSVPFSPFWMQGYPFAFTLWPSCCHGPKIKTGPCLESLGYDGTARKIIVAATIISIVASDYSIELCQLLIPVLLSAAITAVGITS